jgi:hypothetical protein
LRNSGESALQGNGGLPAADAGPSEGWLKRSGKALDDGDAVAVLSGIGGLIGIALATGASMGLAGLMDVCCVAWRLDTGGPMSGAVAALAVPFGHESCRPQDCR